MAASLSAASKVLLGLLICGVALSGRVLAQARVEREAFTFDLPSGWDLLNNDGQEGFDNFNFYNAHGAVIQLGVSKKLRAPTYTQAKSNLRALLHKADHLGEGWMLVRAGSFNHYPRGEFDEAIHVNRARNLTSFSYNVYGTNQIAVFTITLRGENEAAVNEARRLVSGLKWR